LRISRVGRRTAPPKTSSPIISGLVDPSAARVTVQIHLLASRID
jgi:hypothetical protein